MKVFICFVIYKNVYHSCTQSEYKASEKSNLEKHIKAKHEGLCFFVTSVITQQVKKLNSKLT